MAKRTPGQVYQTLIGQGFTPDQATVMTAIAAAESGYDDQAVGDVKLETSTWGPSYGLFQIRTVKGDTGRGTPRDISALASSDATQAKAAWEISKHGTDFTPWSVYSTGAYQAYLPAARQIATQAATTQVGPDWLPWNWASTATSTVGKVRNLALQGLVVVGGLALVGLGLGRMFGPQLQGAMFGAADKVGDAARTAGKAALK